MGKVGNEFVYHGLRLVALSIAIGLSMQGLGVNLNGLAVGLSVGTAAAALAYLLHNQRQLKLSARALLREILLPGFIAYPVATALLLCWQVFLPADLSRWQMLACLLAFGVFYSVAWPCRTAASETPAQLDHRRKQHEDEKLRRTAQHHHPQ